MKNKIDLGMQDSMGLSNPMPMIREEPRVHYPTLCYSGPNEVELPEEGTATIRFKVTRKVEETRNGKEWYQVEMEVQCLCDVSDAGGPDKMFKSSSKDTEDALDKLAKEKMAEEEDDEDEDEE